MEYFDVLDDQGNPTGTTKPRADVHRDGDWHRAVHVFIVNAAGEILYQRRSPNKDSHPNMWDMMAGHVSAGNTPLETVVRETQEELGMKVDPNDVEWLFVTTQQRVLNDGAFLNNEFNDVFLLPTDMTADQMTMQEDEVAELRFIPWREIKQRVEDRDPTLLTHDNEYPQVFKIMEARFS